jgi:hypothetical protein
VAAAEVAKVAVVVIVAQRAMVVVNEIVALAAMARTAAAIVALVMKALAELVAAMVVFLLRSRATRRAMVLSDQSVSVLLLFVSRRFLRIDKINQMM